MSSSNRNTILIATRGSALALAQAQEVMDRCRAEFPDWQFDLTIIKTTGDKLQTASLAQEGTALPKGLFTKELEVALLENKADIAVHSLKDLPTELPPGLKLGAVPERTDVRDVLVFRGGQDQVSPQSKGRRFPQGLQIEELPKSAVIATSSTRRRAQLLELNPDLKVPEIRGNVLTRLTKLDRNAELDGTLLALAGLMRLKLRIGPDHLIQGEGVPPGLATRVLDLNVMLPCVGQGALGIEIRAHDERADDICQRLNHFETHQSVLAERTFLSAMGGGCQSPVAAFAEVIKGELRMRAVSFTNRPAHRSEARAPIVEAVQLGKRLAEQLKG